jgi:hypothetical protein
MQGGSCKAETVDILLRYFGYELRKRKRSIRMTEKLSVFQIAGMMILSGIAGCFAVVIIGGVFENFELERLNRSQTWKVIVFILVTGFVFVCLYS